MAPDQTNVNGGITMSMEWIVRFVFLLGAMCCALTASAETSASKLWSELKAKREMLPASHQQFEATQSFKTSHGDQDSHREIVVDMAKEKWRERTISGSGDRIRIFDGQGLYFMEEQGDEYVQVKRKDKKDEPEPAPYRSAEMDWAKAKEVARRPCGFSENDHTCIIVEVPEKTWTRLGIGGQVTRLSEGFTRLAMDAENGLLVQRVTQEVIDNPRGGYRLDVTYSVRQVSFGTAPDAGLFKLPEGAHEVTALTPWNAARIKKELAGKPAPELEVVDIGGNPVTLSSLKGKTVLLDFWATWCPPCLSDAPALDKLYRKYGSKDLMIVGISVSEEREIVEKFLNKHPHNFPVVLTSENEMPRPYQVGLFPTYMIIAPDGTLTTAVEGDQGLGELRKFLEKAGMETD